MNDFYAIIVTLFLSLLLYYSAIQCPKAAIVLNKVSCQLLFIRSRTLTSRFDFQQARRNVFVSGGGYKFVRTVYNLVVKVVCLKFWHKPRGTGDTSPELWGYNVPPCPHSSDATDFQHGVSYISALKWPTGITCRCWAWCMGQTDIVHWARCRPQCRWQHLDRIRYDTRCYLTCAQKLT